MKCTTNILLLGFLGISCAKLLPVNTIESEWESSPDQGSQLSMVTGNENQEKRSSVTSDISHTDRLKIDPKEGHVNDPNEQGQSDSDSTVGSKRLKRQYYDHSHCYHDHCHDYYSDGHSHITYNRGYGGYGGYGGGYGQRFGFGRVRSWWGRR